MNSNMTANAVRDHMSCHWWCWFSAENSWNVESYRPCRRSKATSQIPLSFCEMIHIDISNETSKGQRNLGSGFGTTAWSVTLNISGIFRWKPTSPMTRHVVTYGVCSHIDSTTQHIAIKPHSRRGTGVLSKHCGICCIKCTTVLCTAVHRIRNKHIWCNVIGSIESWDGFHLRFFCLSVSLMYLRLCCGLDVFGIDRVIGLPVWRFKIRLLFLQKLVLVLAFQNPLPALQDFPGSDLVIGFVYIIQIP